MFERYTERAREVVVLAQQQARDAKRDRIDSVALLLGLLAEEGGLAGRVLDSLHVDAPAVRKHWDPERSEETVPPGERIPAHLPFTTDAKTILELALREALALGHNYIGTEHILLGLVRQCDSDAAMMLHDEFGVNDEAARTAIMRMFGAAPRRPQPAGETVDYDTIRRHRRHLQQILKAFDYEHLHPELQAVSKPFCDLAHLHAAAHGVTPNVHLEHGLQRLLEAKDAIVRAALA